MTSPPRRGAEPSERPWLRGFAIGLGCLLLTLFLAVLQFPWERLVPRASGLVAQTTGARVELADLGMGWSWTGPTLAIEGLRLTWPGSEPVFVDAAELGPAFSSSWLSGEPALAVDLALAGGEVGGTLWPTGEIGFDGDFEGLESEALPLPPGTEELPLAGVLSGEADLRRGANGWQGDLVLAAADGNLLLPGVPVAIPFDEIEVDIDLGEGGAITVHELHLDGPMASFDVTGNVSPAPRLDMAPLNLDVDLRAVSPALHDPMRSQGIVLDAAGNGHATVSGTLSQPIIR